MACLNFKIWNREHICFWWLNQVFLLFTYLLLIVSVFCFVFLILHLHCLCFLLGQTLLGFFCFFFWGQEGETGTHSDACMVSTGPTKLNLSLFKNILIPHKMPFNSCVTIIPAILQMYGRKPVGRIRLQLFIRDWTTSCWRPTHAPVSLA